MKNIITSIITLFCFTAIAANDNGTGTPEYNDRLCSSYLHIDTDANDNGTGKANDNGTGSKATGDGGGERYQAYLKCISQVKASDSNTG